MCSPTCSSVPVHRRATSVRRIVRQSLSAAEARRVALGAQGFADPRPTGRIDRRHLRRVLDRIGLLQIDSVNVLVRSQELPLFARLGPHPRTLIADASADGELYEYWVHEASLLPMRHFPLFRWRMAAPFPWPSVRRAIAELGDYVEEVYRRVAADGPIVASDLQARVGKKGAWWDYDAGKLALEALFRAGRVAVRRRADFARVYDITERVVPATVLAEPAPDEHEAHRQLIELAAAHHGIGTIKDLADYHRVRVTPAKRAVMELVEEGRLHRVDVEGWTEQAYLHTSARLPRRIDALAVLSPFDPVVWCRDRALRLFDFHYRIEIYAPPAKRAFGYYVLPVLLGDRLVGRVDLKADRATRTMLVQHAWHEPGVAPHDVAGPLHAELASMATWLDLDTIEVVGRGDLAPALAAEVAAFSRGGRLA